MRIEIDEFFEPFDTSTEIREVELMIKMQTRLSRAEQIADYERKRKAKIIDALTGKIKLKKPHELYGLLTASPNHQLDDPQNVRLDARGRTALHYIALYSNICPLMCEEVICAGIDKQAVDIDGHTADWYCKDNEMKKLITGGFCNV